MNATNHPTFGIELKADSVISIFYFYGAAFLFLQKCVNSFKTTRNNGEHTQMLKHIRTHIYTYKYERMHINEQNTNIEKLFDIFCT